MTMAFSNKSLLILAVAVLAISIFGTSLSLNLIDSISNTGYVTGTVNLSINDSVSIAMNDSIIDFGTCTISGGFMTFDSNNTAGSINNTNCNGTFPDLMTVENDGNTDANVTVELNSLVTLEYNNADGSYMEFKTADNPNNGGCTTPYGWTNFTNINTPYPACGVLTTASGADQFDFYVRIKIADTAVDNDDSSLGITFTASAS